MEFTHTNITLTLEADPQELSLELEGKRFLAPTSRSGYVEGVITKYDADTGRVTLLTDDDDLWHGYEYQLE
jgi:hypothetical protein